ncbi:SRPBCC family protein [Saccharopolyspora cebuensis]|uniref:SRPBCC family protein n=1 Tax=Saccharopolyspora cebuensis TaxID=418759 RepID=UPI0031E70D13
MVDTSYAVSGSVVVQASPADVFAVLTDPRLHPVIDGSGTVRGQIVGPERLQRGSRFGMRMKLGVGYRISNSVVEYEQDRLVAWKHFAPHRWRYELVERDGGTEVTETFDYSRFPLPGVFARTGIPERNRRSIDATLRRLKSYVENGPAD